MNESILKQGIITQSLGNYHHNVLEVIRLAEDLMDRNQVLNIEILYQEAKRTLKLPKDGLLSIIQFLINNKTLIEGTKFSKKTVLLNQNRYKIYQFIRKCGAVHFSHIRKSFKFDSQGKEINSGQLIWHLNMLIKFNYIKKAKFGTYSVFLPIDINEELGFLIFILNIKINKKIIELVLKNEPIKRSILYKQIDEKKENVYYHLNTLLNSQILIEDDTEPNLVFLNSSKKEILLEIIKMGYISASNELNL